MSIETTCPACGATLRARDELAGKRAKCRCGSVVEVPASSGVSSRSSTIDSGKRRAATATASSKPKAPAPRAPAAAPATARCPECGSLLAPAAALCTGCGFNLKTGKHLAAASVPAAAPAASRAVARRKAGGGGVALPVGAIVKLLLILGVVGGGAWVIKEVRSYDPKKQGEAMLAKLKAGMTVKQVVDLIGKPKAVYTFLDTEQQQKFNTTVAEAKIGYADDFMKAHGAEKLRNGFRFEYQMSMAGLHYVYFDGQGTFQSFEEQPNLFNR